MKKNILLLSLLFVIGLSTKAQSISNTLDDYTAINSSVSLNVEYTQDPSKPAYVKLDVTPEVASAISIEVVNGVLDIKFAKGTNLKIKDNLTIYTNSKSLSKVTNLGSGDILLHATINISDLQIVMKGSGDINASGVKCKNITVSIEGSGDINMKGQTENLTANVNGSGDMNLKNLEAINAKCMLTGSGDMVVNVSGELDAKVNGSGDINYTGKTKNVKKQVNGSGDINRVN